MFFRSFITFATIAATVHASAFNLPDDPLFAQIHGMSHKEYNKYIISKNQYNPHRKPTKPLRARAAAASPDCSSTKKCGSSSQFCNYLGFCKSCPNNGIQNAAGNGCDCLEGYEVVSRAGVSYCECANVVKGEPRIRASLKVVPTDVIGSLGTDGQCGVSPTCVSGYSSVPNAAGGTQCVCTYGASDGMGRCTTCKEVRSLSFSSDNSELFSGLPHYFSERSEHLYLRKRCFR